MLGKLQQKLIEREYYSNFLYYNESALATTASVFS